LNAFYARNDIRNHANKGFELDRKIAMKWVQGKGYAIYSSCK